MLRLSALLAAAACAGVVCGLPALQVHTATQELVDADGRVREFHGVNVVYKAAPFYPLLTSFDPETSLCDEDMANLAKWGFNAVRLGVLWEAVEPEQGKFNTTYLRVMRQLSDRLAAHGIWTLVDAHQDSMTRRFCGEGMPDWAVKDAYPTGLLQFPRPVAQLLPNGTGGMPNLTDCQATEFTLYSFTFAEGAAWKDFFANKRKAFAGYWEAVAAAFNSSTSVIGYELLNEPWFGDVWSNPLYGLDGAKADTANLVPLYTEVYKAVRGVDADTIVWYEPTVTELAMKQKPGFTSGPGGHADDAIQGYAVHIYCLNQNSTGDITNITTCEDTISTQWSLSTEASAGIGGGLMITEFGAVGPHESSAKAIEHLASVAASKHTSWFYWTFKSFHDITTQNAATESFYNDDGSLQQLKLAALSRTYPMATPAMPGTLAYNFDAAMASFNMTFTLNPSSNGLAEVFVPTVHYPRGFNVVAVPSTGVVQVVNGTRVMVQWPKSASSAASVAITAK